MARADSPLRDRLLFVVGARRSGTNWLGRILTAHPAVVGLPSETYLFSHGVAPLAERIQHANPGSMAMGKTFMDRERFLDAMRQMLDEVFADNIERLGRDARYLLERTPWHVSHLPLIADVYPDARAIHIVRDGRAVGRSLVSMSWGPDTIEGAAAEWRDAIEAAQAGAGAMGDRFLELRYERLLEDPRAHTAELFEWLGLELGDDTWERILLEAGSEFNVDPGSPGVAADKWRAELSPEDVRAFEAVAGAQLTAQGYDLAGHAAAPPRRPPSAAPSPLRRLSRPRRAWAAAVRRSAARRARRELHDNYQLVEHLQALFQDGGDAEAKTLFAPQAWVRVQDGGEASEGRGEPAVDRLLAALGEHRERGLRPLSAEIHASPEAFTTVGTYELDDGSRWARTLVVHVAARRVTRLALYRQRLYM
jgi:hypothetical protein